MPKPPSLVPPFVPGTLVRARAGGGPVMRAGFASVTTTVSTDSDGTRRTRTSVEVPCHWSEGRDKCRRVFDAGDLEEVVVKEPPVQEAEVKDVPKYFKFTFETLRGHGGVVVVASSGVEARRLLARSLFFHERPGITASLKLVSSGIIPSQGVLAFFDWED